MKKESTMSEYIQSARIAIFLLIIFVLVTPTLAALERDKKPNIVLVLMDNFGFSFEYTPIEELQAGRKID
jgi:hypothetical protein